MGMGDRKRGPGDGGDGGWRKRPRYDEPAVPPATLRMLVRNQDAGGIIGKVYTRSCEIYVMYSDPCVSVCAVMRGVVIDFVYLIKSGHVLF